jgi:hypothetical protein
VIASGGRGDEGEVGGTWPSCSGVTDRSPADRRGDEGESSPCESSMGYRSMG